MTVTGNDDAAAATVALSHSAAGGDYTTVTVYSVEVKLLATPATPVIHAGLTISKLDLKVPEGGSESYSFVLKHKPSADVSMAVSLPTGNDLSIDETSLTFTPDDWATAQSITVSAAQDDDWATDAEVTITHTISGGQYDDLPMPDVGVTITENDTPGVALSKTSLTVDEGGAGTHTVVLGHEALPRRHGGQDGPDGQHRRDRQPGIAHPHEGQLEHRPDGDRQCRAGPVPRRRRTTWTTPPP